MRQLLVLVLCCLSTMFSMKPMDAQLPVNKGGAARDTLVVLKVDQSPVTMDELGWHINRLRTQCRIYFERCYGAYGGTDYWVHDFGGERPAQWLIAEALDRLLQDHARLKLMKKWGVMPTFSFSHFKAQFVREQDIRQHQLAAGKVIYGNRSFSKTAYYDDLLSKGFLETRRRWLAAHRPEDTVLKQLYRECRERAFKHPPTIEVRVEKRGRSGNSTQEDLRFFPQHRKADELLYPSIFARLDQLTPDGRWTAPFADEQGDVCRLKCLHIKDNGYIAYQEVKTNLMNLYATAVLQHEEAEIKRNIVVQIDSLALNTVRSRFFRL